MALAGQGVMPIDELAHWVGRDAATVHQDVITLADAGVIDHTEKDAEFPYRNIHLDFWWIYWMQELPHWFQHQNASTEVLIKRYKSLSTGIFILQSLGIGATGSAITAGIAQGSKEGSVRTGAKRAGQRLAGQGPLLEEIQRRIGSRLTPAKTNIVGAVVVVGGAMVYFNALEQQEELRLIIMQRFQ